MRINRDTTVDAQPRNTSVQHGRGMPSSVVHTFSDPNEYGETVRAAQTEMTVTAGGPFSARLIRMDLHRLWMQRFSDKAPRLMRAATSPERTIVCFPMQQSSSFYWGAREAYWGSLFLVGAGQEVFQRSTGPSDWAAMSLPVDDFKYAVSVIKHRDVRLQTDGRTILPAADAMAKLRGIYAAASGLAESAPSVLANPEAARSLEQELVMAMVACATDEAEEDSLAVRHHHAILRRFRALIEANVGNPLYLHEICAALGVSNRTLQRCCLEQLGISPLRYLWLRRMHMVRRALTGSGSVPGSVTEIATRYGFWELGRFSVAYRSLFGERPTATLHQPRDTSLK